MAKKKVATKRKVASSTRVKTARKKATKKASGGKTSSTLSWDAFKKNYKTDWKKANTHAKSFTGQIEIDDGSYPAKVIDAAIVKGFSQEGMVALRLTFAVSDGEFEGVTVPTFDDLDPENVRFGDTTSYDLACQKLANIGYELGEEPDFDEIVTLVKKEQPEVEIEIAHTEQGRPVVRRISPA